MDSSAELQPSGSRLLSESSLSHAGDLSLSELSITQAPPFSLLAPPSTPPHTAPPIDDDPDTTIAGRDTARTRDEKLRSDLFVLRKLNAAFASFNDALDATGSANEVNIPPFIPVSGSDELAQTIATQVAQTDTLLNKYVDILSKSEDFSRLIFDEQWQGAVADEEELEREQAEAKDRARREAEERANATQRERERLLREEQLKIEQLERDRVERERGEKAVRGTVRVRGTKASQAAARRSASVSRPSSASTAPSGIRRPSSAAGTAQRGVRRS